MLHSSIAISDSTTSSSSVLFFVSSSARGWLFFFFKAHSCLTRPPETWITSSTGVSCQMVLSCTCCLRLVGPKAANTRATPGHIISTSQMMTLPCPHVSLTTVQRRDSWSQLCGLKCIRLKKEAHVFVL